MLTRKISSCGVFASSIACASSCGRAAAQADRQRFCRPRRGGSNPGATRAKGYTILEVLIVLFLVAFVLSLLIPGISAAYDSSKQVTCRNNLKQVGLAIQMHHDLLGVCPSNGGPVGGTPIPDVNSKDFYPTETRRGGIQTITQIFSVGMPDLGPKQQTGSWAYSILPYIEQERVFKDRAWNIGIPTYICPSRRSSAATITSNDSYGEYIGGGWAWSRTDYAGNETALPIHQCRKFNSIIDGLSQTILCGEKAVPPEVYQKGGWFNDEPFFLGSSGGTVRGGVLLVKDDNDAIAKDNWGSAHKYSVNFVYFDGSVKGIRFAADPLLIKKLLTIDRGDVYGEE